MEASDLPGVGGPAVHPDLQWDGPSRGVLTEVRGGGCVALGVFEEPAACTHSSGGVVGPGFQCPMAGGVFTFRVIIELCIHHDSFPACGTEMCLRSGQHFLILRQAPFGLTGGGMAVAGPGGWRSSSWG